MKTPDNTLKFCQSCCMPMGETDELYGINADGSKSTDYCHYCFKEGEFTSNQTMQEMIESNIPFMLEEGMTEAEARSMLNEAMPSLKRWKA